MRVRCKQHIITTGLDIYFYKHKPSNGVDKQDVCSLEKDMNETYNSKLQEFLKQVKPEVESVKTDEESKTVLNKIISWLETNKGSNYARLYCKRYEEGGIEALKEFYAWLQEEGSSYRESDIYFRKYNWVYAFFQSFLEDEACIVEKHLIEDIIHKCRTVIAAAEKCGINMPKIQNGKIENVDIVEWNKKIDECPNDWINTAKTTLPTKAGFFFGTTDYDFYYLLSIVRAIADFQNLLEDWKEGEICWVDMSW